MRAEVLADHLASTIKALLGPVVAQVAVQDTTIAALTARVVALEGRTPEAGPPGPPGPAGRDGVDAEPLEDRLKGRYVVGKVYRKGAVVMEDGSSFMRTLETSEPAGRPGNSPGWQMMAKRGDRGRDGGHP